MLDAISLLGTLGRVPRGEVSRQIARDTTHTEYVLATAYRTLGVDDPLVVALATSIYRVIDRAVANVVVLHQLDDLGDRLDILLSLAIELYISDVSS